MLRKAFGAALLVALCVAFSPDSSAVTWPPGWELQKNPRMTENLVGKASPGSNQLAIKTDPESNVLAVIEFDDAHLSDQKRPSLEEGLFKVIRERHLESSQKTNTICSSFQKVSLGGLPARLTNCRWESNTHEEKMTIIMAYGISRIYTLIFAGTADGYHDFSGTFRRVWDSIEIDANS